MGSGHDKKKRRAKREASRGLEAARRDEARALQAVRSSSPPEPDAGDLEAMVGAPLKPKPHLRSGAVALPEPTEFEEA